MCGYCLVNCLQCRPNGITCLYLQLSRLLLLRGLTTSDLLQLLLQGLQALLQFFLKGGKWERWHLGLADIFYIQR